MISLPTFRVTTYLLILATISLFVTSFSAPACADNKELSKLKLQHDPIYSIPANRVAEVAVAVKDAEDIEEVRFYFKTMQRDWYIFVTMLMTGKDRYEAMLPPAKNDTKGIDYLFVFKSNNGTVTKSKKYRVLVQNDYTNSPPTTPSPEEVLTELSNQELLLEDFHVPLSVKTSKDPLLAKALQYQHDPINVPGPGSRSGSRGFFGGVGGVAASITLGGLGVSYRAH